jgi:hypothetical protein
MNKVTSVKPLPEGKVFVEMADGRCGEFDVKPCMKSDFFSGFLSALGMAASDAGSLQNLLLAAAAESDNVTMTGTDEYGYRYSLDCTICWYSRESVVRSAWIIKSGEEFPRLTSCYILRRPQ